MKTATISWTAEIPEGWEKLRHNNIVRGDRTVYQTGEKTFVIAENEVWIPGCYDCPEAAIYAFSGRDEGLQKLQDEKNAEAGGTGGIITLYDLQVTI